MSTPFVNGYISGLEDAAIALENDFNNAADWNEHSRAVAKTMAEEIRGLGLKGGKGNLARLLRRWHMLSTLSYRYATQGVRGEKIENFSGLLQPSLAKLIKDDFDQVLGAIDLSTDDLIKTLKEESTLIR